MRFALAYESHSCGSRKKAPPGRRTSYTRWKNCVKPSSPSFRCIHFVIENLEKLIVIRFSLSSFRVQSMFQIKCKLGWRKKEKREDTYASTTSYPSLSSTTQSLAQLAVRKETLCGKVCSVSGVAGGIGRGPNMCSNAAGYWSSSGTGCSGASFGRLLGLSKTLPGLSAAGSVVVGGRYWDQTVRRRFHAKRTRLSSMSTPITSLAPNR